MNPHKVLSVVWRRVWLQSVCRHYTATALEVASVVALAYIFLPLDAARRGIKSGKQQAEPHLRPVKVVYPPSDALERAYRDQPIIWLPTAAVYGPKNAATDALIRAAFPLIPPSNVTAVLEGPDVLDRCREHWSVSRTAENVLCIQFSPSFGQADDSSLDYKLHRFTHKEVPDFLPLPHPDRFSLQRDNETTGIMEDTLEAQSRLDYAFLKSKKTGTNKIPHLRLRQLPEVAPAQDTKVFCIGPLILMAMIYSIPLMCRISSITNELSTGLKDQQRMNGLTMPEFWLGHHLSGLTILMVESMAVIGIMFNVVSKNGNYFFNHSDATLVAFVMALFSICHILQAMVVAALCQTGTRAMTLGVNVAVLLPLVLRSSTISLGELVFRDRFEKLLIALCPQIMGSEVLRTLAIFDDYEGGAKWGALFKHALNVDTVTLFELLTAMCVAAVFYVFLLFFVTNFLPWATDYPLNPLFFLMPHYWKRSPELPSEDVHPDRFDQPPAGEPAAEIRHLSVVFGHHKALDDINIKIYASHVTVLLGHNGAGKTTLMRALTGFLKPTSGSFKFEGGEGVQRTTAFCQQSDVLFPDLTVNEHLIYYGHLQCRRGLQLTKLITETLEAVKLTDKVHCFPSQLSGGMRRRLSMSIALVSKAKILILDEPTTGMDAETRRSIWDLISTLRTSSTILLSTHDMEEAEVLADRIVIMHSGKIIGAGTQAFLKKACGVGYTINLSTDPEKFVPERALAEVHKAAPDAVVKDVKQGSATIALHTIEHSGFVDMFRALEKNAEQLGIQSFGVNVATMADAYIKINKVWATQGDQDTDRSTAQSAPPVQVSSCSGVTTHPSSRQRARALLTNRLRYWSRSPLEILYGWLGMVVSVVVYWESFAARFSEATPPTVTSLQLKSSVHFRGAHSFLHTPREPNFSRHFEELAKSEGVSITPMANATRELVDFARRDFAKYYSYYAYGVSESHMGGLEGWYNQASPVSLNVLLNLIDTALLRAHSNSSKGRFTTSVSFYSGGATTRDVKPNEEVPPVYLKLSEALIKINRNNNTWNGITTGIMCVTLCCVVQYHIAEKVSGMRELQLMTGLSGPLYVATHFLFDLLIKFLAPLGVCFAIYSIRYADLTADTIVFLYVLVLAVAPMAILESYTLVQLLQSQAAVDLLSTVLFFIGGPLSDHLYLLAIAKFPSLPQLRRVFMILPPFALKEVVLRTVNLDAATPACSAVHAFLKSTDVSKLPAHFCAQWALANSLLEQCCLSALKNPGGKLAVPGPLSLSEQAVLKDVGLIMCAGAVLFILLSFLNSGKAMHLRAFLTRAYITSFESNDAGLDEDVRAEKELVQRLASNGASAQLESEGCTLVASNLQKTLGSLWAVRGINLALRRGECFGLLGVNGAGKTTTFRILTGLLAPTAGDAYMADVTLSASPRKWQSFIGYCPQSDQLLKKLSAFEHLRLFSRLRGIPEPQINEAITAAIALADLEQYAAKSCGVYSGGNKRKLLMATSILGNPRIVLMDEPYAGVDVIAREKIGGNLSAMRKQTNIPVVLTSHCLEECETSCDRLSIMVAGQMTCLGTLQHLKDKFGMGYSMQLVLPLSTAQRSEGAGSVEASAETSGMNLDKQVADLFPGVRVLGAHDNVRDYQITEKLPWSTIFEKVEELEKSFAFDHVLIQDTNLEKIFISIASKGNTPGTV